jgi:hypothetical protein
MIPGHWFWWLLVMTCLLWYAFVTVYVAVKGTKDVRSMLNALTGRRNGAERTGE